MTKPCQCAGVYGELLYMIQRYKDALGKKFTYYNDDETEIKNIEKQITLFVKECDLPKDVLDGAKERLNDARESIVKEKNTHMGYAYLGCIQGDLKKYMMKDCKGKYEVKGIGSFPSGF